MRFQKMSVPPLLRITEFQGIWILKIPGGGRRIKNGKIPGGCGNFDEIPGVEAKNTGNFQGSGEIFDGTPGDYSFWKWISSTGGYGVFLKKPNWYQGDDTAYHILVEIKNSNFFGFWTICWWFWHALRCKWKQS